MSGKAERGSILKAAQILAASSIEGFLPPGSPGPVSGVRRILEMAGVSTPHSSAKRVTVNCFSSMAFMIGVRSTVFLSTVRLNFAESRRSLVPLPSSVSSSSASFQDSSSFHDSASVLVKQLNFLSMSRVLSSIVSCVCSNTSGVLDIVLVGTSIVWPASVSHTMYSPDGIEKAFVPIVLMLSRAPSVMCCFNSALFLKALGEVAFLSSRSKSSVRTSSFTAFVSF